MKKIILILIMAMFLACSDDVSNTSVEDLFDLSSSSEITGGSSDISISSSSNGGEGIQINSSSSNESILEKSIGFEYVSLTPEMLEVDQDYDYHVVTSYSSNKSGITVVVKDKTNPVRLLLTSYEANNWNIVVESGVDLQYTLIDSYYSSTCSGIADSIFDSYSYKKSVFNPYDYYYADNLADAVKEMVLADVYDIAPIVTFQSFYYAPDTIVVDGVVGKFDVPQSISSINDLVVLNNLRPSNFDFMVAPSPSSSDGTEFEIDLAGMGVDKPIVLVVSNDEASNFTLVNTSQEPVKLLKVIVYGYEGINITNLNDSMELRMTYSDDDNFTLQNSFGYWADDEDVAEVFGKVPDAIIRAESL